MARWQYCNVLRFGSDTRQVWQFTTGKKFALQKEETKLSTESLNTRLFAKDWEHLLQPRLNVAWLPPEQVYLHVVQLPLADEEEETRSMLELQLEKLSPLPVAQVVWSYETIASEAGMQTVVVIIVARHVVEAFLGNLESLSYFADRLELSFLDQLRAEAYQGEGIWVFAGWGGKLHAGLIAWRQGGILRNLGVIHLPKDTNAAEVLQAQLRQMKWSGELEGWLTEEPAIHLVADEETAEVWRPLFDLDQNVSLTPPSTASELAVQTARRVVGAQNGHTNLLPEEYNSRYKQRFVDRIWMRSLGAAAALYMIGVAIYFGWVELAKWKYNNIHSDAMALSVNYTNTLLLRDELRLLEDQKRLKFAALDCWKVAADNLPPELTLDQFNFNLSRGSKVTYYGLVDSDNVEKVNDFYDRMREASVQDLRLFKAVDLPKISPRPPRQMAWSFTCELEFSESQ